jgi:hypothetical protein
MQSEVVPIERIKKTRVEPRVWRVLWRKSEVMLLERANIGSDIALRVMRMDSEGR